MMNIQSFGLIEAKYLNPMAQSDLSPISYGCWWFAHVFFDFKFMSIFSMLFGAGIVLMWQRAKSAGRSFTWLHYRRMFWLLLFGLVHAHFFWVGDILFAYGIGGMLVIWLCGLKPRWLIPIGLVLLSMGSLILVAVGLSMSMWPEEALAELREVWNPTSAQIAENLKIHRGSWLDAQAHRSETALTMQTFGFVLFLGWRACGLMLIGMSLFKLGVLSGIRSVRFYVVCGSLTMLSGLALVLAGLHYNEVNHWSMEYSLFLGSQFNYWGSVLISLSYICFVVLACKKGWLAKFQRSLAAVGQMALTNYLMQTVICTTIFYGHGFGWFGYLSRPSLVGIVAAIWILQLSISPIWLKQFRFGPLEWLWRSLSYWKLQPQRRTSVTFDTAELGSK